MKTPRSILHRKNPARGLTAWLMTTTLGAGIAAAAVKTAPPMLAPSGLAAATGAAGLSAPPAMTAPPAAPALDSSLERADAKAAIAAAAPIADPASLEARMTPGLDARLLPAVEALKREIESSPRKRRELGHLLWTLNEHLKDGGILRFGDNTNEQGEVMGATAFDGALNGVYFHDSFMHSGALLQAAALAFPLQDLHDLRHGRSITSKESLVRALRATDAFLDGVDEIALADKVDINNDADIWLYKLVANRRGLSLDAVGDRDQALEDKSSVDQEWRRARETLAQSQRKLGKLRGDLDLVLHGQRRKPGPELDRKRILLSEELKFQRAQVMQDEAREHRLRVETRLPGRKGLDTPLSLKRTRSRLDLSLLRTVPAPRGPFVAERLGPAFALLKETILTSGDAATRGLSYIVDALEELERRGGRIKFAPPGSKDFAEFDHESLELSVGARFLNVHPALQTLILGHEATHVADYFAGRPMTRETELNAFKVEGILSGNFDPDQIAPRLDARNPAEVEAFANLRNMRMKHLEGKISLESMVSGQYADLRGTHLEGVQTATQHLEELRTAELNPLLEELAELMQELELVEGKLQSKKTPRLVDQRRQLLKAVAIKGGVLRLARRRIAQLESVSVKDADARPAGASAASLAGIASIQR